MSHRAGKHVPSVVWFLVMVILWLGGDLWLKSWAFANVAGPPVTLRGDESDRTAIPPHDATTLVPYVLALKLTTNTGAIFGLGKGARWLFIAVTAVATAVIVTVFCRSLRGRYALHTALAMILAGALGNLYDRYFYSAVRDMLWLFPELNLPMGLNWPGGDRGLYPWIFNIADVALVVGVSIMVVIIFRDDMRQRNAQKAAD